MEAIQSELNLALVSIDRARQLVTDKDPALKAKINAARAVTNTALSFAVSLNDGVSSDQLFLYEETS